MTPERWQQIANVVDRALELEASQRCAFIEQACSSDPSMRREIESLLSSENQVLPNFLQSAALPEGLIANLQEVGSGTVLEGGQVFAERFLLLRKLGEGGMGQVWLAEQTSPVRRQVALKLIKAGMYDQLVVQRFQSERQSLAIMDHPAIAKVFDAGTTLQGQPYFVMEYVPGQPITEYCDQKKLPIRGRLELFIQACEGVQHAHQKAIIHRDLKPANILVVEVDGHPVPRIIDFGLAKATMAQADGQSLFTQMGQFVGTPGYMSPEQADPNVRDIDTRTDVYSLGVVLYMLLSGARPLDEKPGEKLPLDELLKRLREEEPVRPSARVSSDRENPSATAEARSTDPKQLVSQLRGDLDWITMKALEKDRARRYGTPSELAADIRRYLNHKPVTARPASTAYRIRKYVRRHRVALATASAIGLVLLVAAAVSIRAGVRASREAAVAEAVNDFLQNDLLAQAGASAQSGSHTKPDPDLKVRTALDRAAERIEGKFKGQPEVEASIRDTMGWTYKDLGLYPEAHRQLERALELRQRVLGTANAKTLESMSGLGWVVLLEGKYAQAEALESNAMEAQRRVLGPENRETLKSMNTLAGVYEREGKYSQAEALDTQLLDVRRRVLGPEHRETFASMDNLATVYGREGKYTEAEALLAQVLETKKRVFGPEHPGTLISMNDLSVVYYEEGKFAQAAALDVQNLEIRKRVLGPEHPETLQSMSNLANDYAHEGKYAQALALEVQTLHIQKRVLGPEHELTAATVYNMACLTALRGDKDRAIALLSQSVDHGLPPYVDLTMEKDTDLASLQGDPRFAALVAHAKQVSEAKQKAASAQASN